MYSLEQVLERVIDVEDDIDILTGLYIQRLGYIPKEGECIDFPEFNAEIKRVKASKILKVKIYPKKLPD